MPPNIFGMPQIQIPPLGPRPTESSGGIAQNGQGPFDPFGPDFLKDLFGEEPRLGFFGALQNQNFSPIQRQFFQTQFQPFQDRFFGSSANLLQGGTALGELPTFQDFLGGVNFKQEFQSLPPGLRPGSGTARFAPPTQFRF